MRYSLSAVVMAHPRRAESATRLAARLGRNTTAVYDPVPDGPPSPLRAATEAWSHCVPGATHHLVVQDDVEPCARWWELADRAVNRFPDDVLALYANSTSGNGAAARIALLAGHTWLTPTRHEYFPTLAVAMPCRIAHEFSRWSRPRAARHRKNDDEVLAQFLREKGYRTRLRVPNLVDHRELPSVAGNDEHGIRRSVCFQADHPWSVTESTMDTPPAWPQFYERRAFLRVAAPEDRSAPRTVLADELFDYVDSSATALRLMAKEAFPRPVPVDGWSVEGVRFVRELCLGAFCLGRVLSRIGADPRFVMRRRPVQEAAMRSFIESGLGDAELVDLWADSFRGLLDGCWSVVGQGMRPAGARPPAGDHTVVPVTQG